MSTNTISKISQMRLRKLNESIMNRKGEKNSRKNTGTEISKVLKRDDRKNDNFNTVKNLKFKSFLRLFLSAANF